MPRGSRTRGIVNQNTRASTSLSETEVDAGLFMMETFQAKCERMMPQRLAAFRKLRAKLEGMRVSIAKAKAANNSTPNSEAAQ